MDTFDHVLSSRKHMQVQVFLKGKKEALVYEGDKIDVLDFEMEGVKYKQVRHFDFKKGHSKSEFIEENLIDKVITK